MTSPRDDLVRYLENYREEIDGAAIYRALAEAEKHPDLSAMYLRLARSEEGHASIWARKIVAAGGREPGRRPSWRARTMAVLARRFGPNAVLPTVVAMEDEGIRRYGAGAALSAPGGEEGRILSQERHHARMLSAVSGGVGVDGPSLSRMEGRHRAIGGNALRAAVLGANDGLVSNLSLVMGVAGASLSERGILLTGLAGLIAGACSMAMGEWLSVKSSRELNERQLAIEASELAEMPKEEEAELALIYRAKGLPDDQARALAAHLISDPKTALDTLAREELGLDPEEMGGSPWEAALTSFILFAMGAVIPVLPYMFLSGQAAWWASLCFSSAALVLIGAGITLLTGRGLLESAFRQLAIGLSAAGLTFAVGKLLGVAIS